MEARVSASATDVAPLDGVGAYPITEEVILARVERLPFSAWHLRTVALVGLASLFDAFDSLTIAFVVPVLAGVWGLSPSAIGLLISAGYVGQLIGAIALTALAERLGRLSALRLRWAYFQLSASPAPSPIPTRFCWRCDSFKV